MNRNEVDPDVSPGMAYGARLRRSREERGWTQEELGARMGYSGTHISAVENGRRPPTPHFSAMADKVLGTGGEFEREGRSLRTPAVLEGFPEYVAQEMQAAEVRVFELGIIPGVLQTPEYAAAIAAGAVDRGTITEEQAQSRLSLVARRQDALNRSPAPSIFVVLDESCIRRPVGGPSLMRAQLGRLIEFAGQANTVLQVAPYELGARRAFDLPLYILTMRDRSHMSYAESAQRGHLERETASVVPLLTAYHHLAAESLSQAASVAMIQEARKGMS
ncbi:helix-turn-helix transcriptional regulator [Streptomyces sp. NPDC046203]|uniref:helix-turn-helix domain-containing protein n=1 Tax=Streptomyces sp. NPDC046203 TaxID=3154602 RepID=UPI0033D47A86